MPTTRRSLLKHSAATVAALGLSGRYASAQADPKAWIWVRGAGGFPTKPTIIAGLDKVIHVAPLHLALPLGAVYAGIAEV